MRYYEVWGRRDGHRWEIRSNSDLLLRSLIRGIWRTTSKIKNRLLFLSPCPSRAESVCPRKPRRAALSLIVSEALLAASDAAPGADRCPTSPPPAAQPCFPRTMRTLQLLPQLSRGHPWWGGGGRSRERGRRARLKSEFFRTLG